VKGNEYLPGCGPNGPRVEGGAVEVAAVRLMNMGLVRTESQSPEPSARSNLGEIPPSLSLHQLFPISSSSSLQGRDVSTYVLNCQVSSCLTRAQSPNEQQTRVRTARENDRESGRSLTNGIPVDCARSGDYFDHLDEPTGLHPDLIAIYAAEALRRER
jgi:hypothetical protein